MYTVHEEGTIEMKINRDVIAEQAFNLAFLSYDWKLLLSTLFPIFDFYHPSMYLYMDLFADE